MAISEQARHQMYSRLEAVLGADEATTLMEHLPPVGWADVVTKRDLDAFGQSLRGEMAVLRAEVRGEIAALRGEMGRELGSLRGEMGRELGSFRGEMGRELGSLRGELHLQGRNVFFQMLGLQLSSVVLITAVVRFL